MPLPPAPATTDADSTSATHRGRWVVVLLLAAFCLIAWISWKLARALGAFAWGFQPPAMAAAQHSTQDVIGDLGGMPVKISRFVAEYVEYEGDPGWSGPRKGPPPERTYASRLESFGFRVRYPDMATLETSEMRADRASYNIYNTPWIKAGVITGPIYPGRGFMNRPHVANGKLRSDNWWDDFVEVKQKKYGLTAYRQARPPPDTLPAESMIRHGRSVYLFRDDAGNVITWIECSNVPHEAAPCRQSWDMGTQGVGAEVNVLYRVGLLEHWREIQQSVSQVIMDFRVSSLDIDGSH